MGKRKQRKHLYALPYNWTTIHYNTDTSDTKVSKTYGFNVNDLSGSGRYVRIYVENAVLHNNNSNWYTPMVYEIKVFGQSQAAAYNKLKNYYEQCKNFSGDLYTEESYNYFADILSQAKSLIDNSYASSSQYEAMYASLQDAVSKLEINSDAIVEVTGTVAPAAVCVNQMPDLPDTIEVKTYNGQIKQAEISWQNLSESRFTVPYSTVKVDGTITGTSIGVSVNVEVVPQNLVYFIDCNNQSSDAFSSVKASFPSILNDKADQKYSDTWGVQANSMTLYGKTASETDKTLTGYYGDNKSTGQIEYVLPVEKAGTYKIYLAVHEWWVGPRTMNWDAVYTDKYGNENTVRLATDLKVSSSARDNSIEAEVTVDGPTTLKLRGYISGGTEAAVISFIGVSCVGSQTDDPVDKTEEIIVDSFDSLNSSDYVKNENGNSITVSASSGRAKVDYTVGDPSYAGFTKYISSDWSEGVNLLLDVENQTNGREIVIQFRDKNGNYFEKRETLSAGSTTLVIALDTFDTPSWANSASADLSAITEYSVYIETGSAGAGSGTVYLDNLIIACTEDDPVQNPYIENTAVTFDAQNAADIAVNTVFDGTALTAVKYSGNALSCGTDYTVSDSAVIIGKAFLAELDNGTYTLSFVFSNGSTADLTVTVVNKEVIVVPPVIADGGVELISQINDWGSGCGVSIQVHNTGSLTCATWKIIVSKSDFEIDSYWNFTITESGSDYILTPPSWQQSLNPNESAYIGMNLKKAPSTDFGYTVQLLDANGNVIASATN